MSCQENCNTKDLILQGLHAIIEPGHVHEIRIPKTKWGTVSGYYDDVEKAVESILRYNGEYNIYITLNPCNSALLARAANRPKQYSELTTSDKDILKRTKILLDFDPVRPAGISSSDDEKKLAFSKMLQAIEWLRSQGWELPVCCDSGNGYHCLYTVDLPNTDESTQKVKKILETVGNQIDDEFVTLDKTVFNAARITKLYGTTAVKGDSIPSRPHRISRVLEVGDVF